MKNLILITTLALSVNIYGQVEGFWQVEKVEVGEKAMTPVVKWFKINADHTQSSGNGWLQNVEGTWSFDKNTYLFTPVNNDGVIDESGPFAVSFIDQNMIWEREEEGMLVRVTLFPIDKLPQGPADRLLGLWDFVSVEKNGENVMKEYDPEQKRYLFFQWDHRFRDVFGPQGKTSGTWQMNGHHPILHLINDNNVVEQFTVSFGESTMILIGKSTNGENLKLSFARITSFPNE